LPEDDHGTAPERRRDGVEQHTFGVADPDSER